MYPHSAPSSSTAARMTSARAATRSRRRLVTLDRDLPAVSLVSQTRVAEHQLCHTFIFPKVRSDRVGSDRQLVRSSLSTGRRKKNKKKNKKVARLA